MAYVPIAKLEKFTGEENNVQVWLNDMEKAITANGWNDNRVMQTIPYFLQDTANGETEAITTYLRCFHRTLCQIQAIQADYFTHICPMHPADLQATVTNARDFEAAELKTNHIQAINLVMNKLSELDSKLKQFSNFINQKLERYLANNQAIYQPPQ
ncbi:hypothetical protein G9A89_014395 [Geosiphon pyriformis]|nr:hypothetical protein G9A89_014395 [Geosiphon pyriformis]